MMKHCCKVMNYYIENYDQDSLVYYDESIRSYALKLHNVECGGTHRGMLFCPWCGSRLPEELDEEWGAILKKEYGITEPFFEDKDKVPPEFRTDEWWKKRGL